MVSLLVHGAAIIGWIGLAPGTPAPVEHPRVGLIQVLGGVPVELVARELPPLPEIRVEVMPPPEPAEVRFEEPPLRPFEEPAVDEPPLTDRSEGPRFAALPETSWRVCLRPTPAPIPVPVEVVATAEPVPPPSAPGQVVEPVPIDEFNAPPRYPPRAVQLRLQGRVMLRVVIDTDGHVRRCDVGRSSGYDILDHAAVAAVEGWSFRDGPGEIDLPIDFVLHARGG